MIKCQVAMDALEKIAPRRLAEDWDNVGLMTGSPAQAVHKIFVCLDVTQAVVLRAVESGCDMIVSHHPLIFKPIKNLRSDLPQGKLLQSILENHLIVFSAHTNLDITDGGVNDVLAEKIGLTNLQPFVSTEEEELVKLVVFVPEEQADAVRFAIGDAGAGAIGGYSHCSFSARGEGMFLPGEGTHPFVGIPGKMEKVDEVKIETILPLRIKNKVVRAMLKAHPYEEVAYDIYPLKNTGKTMSLGRFGELVDPLEIEEFAALVKKSLPVDGVRFVRGGKKLIKKVALCSGSGAEFITKAAYMGADAYVTGDVKYHEAQKAEQLGMHLIDAGHFGTEMPVVQVLADLLRRAAIEGKWKIEVLADEESQDVFHTI
jgi:dinuclear metal center YbgI/SA1388 family protein